MFKDPRDPEWNDASVSEDRNPALRSLDYEPNPGRKLLPAGYFGGSGIMHLR
jgi:hypothetical protein